MYSYIPVDFSDLTLMPYRTGLINDNCRNQFDHTTNLCMKYCTTTDGSELCEWAHQFYCSKFEAFRTDCSARCKCPSGTIYYTPLHNICYKKYFCSKSNDNRTKNQKKFFCTSPRFTV